MSQSATIIKNIKFIPTGYTETTTPFASMSDMSNAYKDADASPSTYATLVTSGSWISTVTSAVFLNVDTSALANIPSDAVINSLTLRVCYATSGLSAISFTLYTGSSQNGRVEVSYNNTNAPGTFYVVGANESRISDWNLTKLSNVRACLWTKPRISSTGKVFLSGLEIIVNLSYNGTQYMITMANSTSATVWPTGSTQADALWVNEYEDAKVYVTPSGSLNEIVVKDNDVDVTSSLTTPTSGSAEFIPTSVSYEVVTVTDPQDGFKPYTNTDTYAEMDIAGRSGGNASWFFDTSIIPEMAEITSVECKFHATVHRYTSSSLAQLYTNSTAKGSATQLSTAVTDYTITGTGWTRQEVSNINLRFNLQQTGSQTAYTRFYGATLTVEYDFNGATYMYTISNIAADHQIQVMDAKRAMMKIGDSWWPMSKVYKKVGNVWVQEQNPVGWFDDGTVYIPGY